MAAGKRVILPLTVRDPAGFLDLDWAVYTGPDSVAPRPVRAARAHRSAAGPRRDRDPRRGAGARAWRSPPTGYRIGKGAGCYDRALARVPAGTFVCVLLYDDEVGRAVPVEPHDRPVTAAVTPRGITRLG